MADINVIKRLLGIGANETAEVVSDIAGMVEAQLKNRLGGVSEIPQELGYVVTNVTVARYNQIGDEGKSSMTVEGESASWLTDLFAPFEEDIQRYLDRVNATVSGGSIRFL